LQAKGITVVVQDYSEVMRLPGAYRCTTMPVRRTP
jgi:arginine deiminase